MICVFTGGLGQGKTLSMTVLASYMAYKMKCPIFANYALVGSRRIHTFQDLVSAKHGVVALDEAHITLDSRNFKDKTSQKITHWVLQTRKVDLIILMTTQSLHQIDVRARDVTDIVMKCKKTPEGIWLQSIDWCEKTIGRRNLLAHVERFYPLYDTYQIVDPIE